jgi:hypothetical protein
MIFQRRIHEKYLKPRRPVVIKNMAKKWPAYQNGQWNI